MSGKGLPRLVAVFLAALAFPPAGTGEECPPAHTVLASSYQAPCGFEYAPAEELKERVGTDGHALGVITTAVGWDVEVGIRKQCRGTECRLCVDRIEGTAGFGPGRIRVSERLRGDQCRTDAVLAHEERHSRVFEESTRLGVRRLVDSLTRWAGGQVALHATPETADAAASVRHREIEALMKEGAVWIEERARTLNEHIDNEGAYRTEIEEMERRCR